MLSLPVHQILFAPWEYLVFLFELSPLRNPSPAIDAYQQPIDGIPSIVTYNFSDVVEVTTEIQKVGLSLPLHRSSRWASIISI